MQRSQEEAEELIRALEVVWTEQAEAARIYRAEATDLWRLHAAHERVIADLRGEIEKLRARLAAAPEQCQDAAST